MAAASNANIGAGNNKVIDSLYAGSYINGLQLTIYIMQSRLEQF